MDIKMKCTLNGKEYTFSTNCRLSVISCRCVTTDRRITSDKTLAAVLNACVEAAHAEALSMDDAEMSRRCRGAVFFGSLDSFGRRVIVEAAHGEALEINAEIDEVAAADQWDEWANQHDSRKTKAQMIESDHAEALEMDMQDHQHEFFRSSTMMQAVWLNLNHAEALEMNVKLDAEYASIEKLVTDEDKKPLFKAVASHFIVGCPAELPNLK